MRVTKVALVVAAILGLVACNNSDDQALRNQLSQISQEKQQLELEYQQALEELAEKEADNTFPLVLPPHPDRLFIRGVNGQWDASNELTYVGNNTYLSILRVDRGSHRFKVANDSWGYEQTVPGKIIELGVQETMIPKPDVTDDCTNDTDCNSMVTFPAKGYYKFILDLVDVKSGKITIKKVNEDELGDLLLSSNIHAEHEFSVIKVFPAFDGTNYTVKTSVKDSSAALREFGISSTEELRDGVEQGIIVKELANLPVIHTGSLLFDANFAISINEMKQLSVSEIKDGNYNNNQPLSVEAFETGAKWHYVWTRDLSYAANLSLAFMDPERVKNSLEFKLSDFRDGTNQHGVQIIQDTGTGGSWPISTDRVTWAFGADKLLQSLTGDARTEFATRAYKALVNTINADRIAAFDPTLGLYTGEQSFLDWREQTYSSWSPEDVNYVGTSKSLSTNVAHYKAIRLAEKLAIEFGDDAEAIELGSKADDLKVSINENFWDAERGMYASYIFGHKSNIKVDKYDMLGISLAILEGIASPEQAKSSMSHYPHAQYGVPVYFPQQPDTPIYHNRGIWPFVTAYSLRAGVEAGNVAAVNNAFHSLVRGTSLNLSNMENLEWLSGKPKFTHSDYLVDGQENLDGPVINSQRQLWSVGGYIGMVIHDVFGFDIVKGEISVNPFITTEMKEVVFGDQDEISISGIMHNGVSHEITIKLPEGDTVGKGRYAVESVVRTDDSFMVQLGDVIEDDSKITLVDTSIMPYDLTNESVFSPVEPAISATIKGEQVLLDIENHDYDIKLFANGKLIDTNNVFPYDGVSTTCFVAEAIGKQGWRSNLSKPVCVGEVEEMAFQPNGSFAYEELEDGTKVIKDFGKPGDVLQGKDGKFFNVETAGKYDFAIKYINNQGPVNTGITNAVKRLTIKTLDGAVVHTGIVQMAHGLNKGDILTSAPVAADLPVGQYTFELSDHFNMSYLESNETYSAVGGLKGFVNYADVISIGMTTH
ncbi:Six-hairpin glycosidase-like protein [Moritella sp. Urea-trap-13]|uniref:Six-hairpin glycosidase-like protein n=1 Tax=Moritella sp. Urea-trap-13 TaxID=2058327 RepID=UPI000C325E12|nr:Six-hairpin glycosidase-like protein [Moritella sp. Urea-trap-13]PKH07112.1 Six-hairpin glycosidase-like protein [Moritella sp. Urea-trap-13]